MIYLLAGIENSRFKADVSHPDLGGEINIRDSYSFSANKWVFVSGIGIETMLSDKVSLKAEYTYADYGTFDSSHSKQLSPSVGALIPTTYYECSSDKINLNRGLFTLGLSYHFNGI